VSRFVAPIVVTGAAGFIGYHLCRRLLDMGHTVLGIDNLNDYYDVSLKRDRLAGLQADARFTFEKCDLGGSNAFAQLVAATKPKEIVHLAAQAGVRYSLERPHAYASNVTGFLDVLEACRHNPVSHLIYASSSSVYGTNAKVPFSEHDNADHPLSLYAATKRANELMAHAYANLYGIRATGLRFFTVYGPWGRPDMAYFRFTRAIADGKPIDVYNDGNMQRDFTYVDDVIDAIIRLVPKPPAPNPNFDPRQPDPATGAVPHRIYNIGNHSPVDLTRFIAAIETALGKKAERRLLPMQPGDVPVTYADIRDIAAAVGFAPRTSIEGGIVRFVDWYRSYYGAPNDTVEAE
jgi:UDP-glucuronate 4-epimerase